MGIKDIIGFLASATSILLQLSPLPEVINALRIRDIKNLTISYFMGGIGQTLFWIGYGVCINDMYVLIPNITLAFLFGFYMNSVIYIKKQYNLFYILNPIIIIGVYLILKFCPEHLCDSMATIISIIWQSTNSLTMRLALKYRDPAYINLLVSFVSWTNMGLFWIYSLMIGAYIMFIPNIYGFSINSINMYLYFWACGYFAESNCFINILKIILKPEKVESDNTKQVHNDNIDYDNTKEDFINKI